MNWDRIEGEWKQRRGKAVRHWGNMMNDELAGAAGRYEQLVGRLQEKYGRATEHIAEFQKTADQLKKANKRLMQALESMIRETKSNSIRKRSLGKKQNRQRRGSGAGTS